jgi:hypothetical protein
MVMKNVFSSVHLKFFGLSLVLLIVGYVLLAQGPVDNPLSKTLAPMILVGVYCVLIPIALVVKDSVQDMTKKK